MVGNSQSKFTVKIHTFIPRNSKSHFARVIIHTLHYWLTTYIFSYAERGYHLIIIIIFVFVDIFPKVHNDYPIIFPFCFVFIKSFIILSP